MSLVPMLYSEWWDDIDRPRGIIDQHFGLPVVHEDILHRGGGVITNRHAENLGYPFFRRTRRRHHPFHHALAGRYPDKVASNYNNERDKFRINLDVKQFSPDEIIVKTIDKNVVVIEAKHEEKEDEHGWISRQFTRKYNVPTHFDIEQIETLLSSDGVLTITAPKKKSIASNEKIIKIQYTGEPAIFEQQTSVKSVDVHGEEFNRDQQQQRGQMSQQRGKKVIVKGI